MSPRLADSLTFLGLAGLLALVSLTAPRWARFLRQPLPVVGQGVDETDSGPEEASTSAPSEDEAQRHISVKLFFEAPDRPGFVLEDRSVLFHADLPSQLRVVLEELIRGSQAGLLAPLAPETKVLDVFVTASGIAYADLSKEAAPAQLAGGSKAEMMTVYAVVNSIVVNFPAVKRVQILVNDQPAQTLAGHIDLSRPLAGDLTLLAAADLAPLEPAAEGEAPVAPRPVPSPVS